VKRQLQACAWVAAALFLMIKWAVVVEWGIRAYAPFSSGGLQVTYYRGVDFSSVVCRRTERRVVRDYGEWRPAWRVPRTGYSARWQGFLDVPETAVYNFYLQSDDGSRLFIADRLIIDYWGDHGWIPGKNAELQLTRGRHPIILEHYNRLGPGAIRLLWKGGPVSASTVVSTPYISKE
jgi:hypothetical protein